MELHEVHQGALRRVLDYLQPTEESDYEELGDEGDRELHIVHDLRLLRELMERDR